MIHVSLLCGQAALALPGNSAEHLESTSSSVVAQVYNPEVETRGLRRISGQPGLGSVHHCGEFLMLSFHQLVGVCIASFEELFWLIYGNYMWACLFVSCVYLGVVLIEQMAGHSCASPWAYHILANICYLLPWLYVLCASCPFLYLLHKFIYSCPLPPTPTPLRKFSNCVAHSDFQLMGSNSPSASAS